MEGPFKLVIVIPTYNEAKRISLKKYLAFLAKNKEVMLCFVNDGSTDKTNKVLHNIWLSAKGRVKIINHDRNRGKAAAVLTGIGFCNKNIIFDHIAYLDADLSTSLDECLSLSKEIDAKTTFVFGSRIRKLDSFIRRKSHRFLIGRFVATLISLQLDLHVYDTQCGCKVFSRQLSQSIFKDEFISTWLFDVEIFHRVKQLYGKQQLLRKAKEVPLRSWIDKNHSKVSIAYFFKMCLELILIAKKYRLKNQLGTQLILNEAVT